MQKAHKGTFGMCLQLLSAFVIKEGIHNVETFLQVEAQQIMRLPNESQQLSSSDNLMQDAGRNTFSGQAPMTGPAEPVHPRALYGLPF